MVQVGTVLTALVDMDVRTGVDSGSDVARIAFLEGQLKKLEASGDS